MERFVNGVDFEDLITKISTIILFPAQNSTLLAN